jgi:hypothetical protein
VVIVWGTTLKIMNGLGSRHRQVVEVHRNVEAASREEARELARAYARELGLGVLLDDPDVRLTENIILGEGVFT